MCVSLSSGDELLLQVDSGVLYPNRKSQSSYIQFFLLLESKSVRFFKGVPVD